MSSKVPTREEAYQLLTEYNKSDSLIKHALAVEGVMGYFGRKRGEDEEKWRVIGLVHDLDYEQFPEEHCHKSEEILKEKGWPEEYIRAVVSHGWGLCSEVEPQTELEKVLYTIDELTGLVVTTALVRPSKSVMDVKVKSVKMTVSNKGIIINTCTLNRIPRTNNKNIAANSIKNTFPAAFNPSFDSPK